MNHGKFTGWRKFTYSNSSGGCVEVATATAWRKSTYSESSGDCVEIAAVERSIRVRDSKQHGLGTVLEFSGHAWQAFLAEAKEGGFDL